MRIISRLIILLTSWLIVPSMAKADNIERFTSNLGTYDVVGCQESVGVNGYYCAGMSNAILKLQSRRGIRLLSLVLIGSPAAQRFGQMVIGMDLADDGCDLKGETATCRNEYAFGFVETTLTSIEKRSNDEVLLSIAKTQGNSTFEVKFNLRRKR